MLNDKENDTYIKKSAEACDTVILAWGTGAACNKRITERISMVMDDLKDYVSKMYVISDGDRRGLHPLTPVVRDKWVLEKYAPA
jgi:hypothetical protein